MNICIYTFLNAIGIYYIYHSNFIVLIACTRYNSHTKILHYIYMIVLTIIKGTLRDPRT